MKRLGDHKPASVSFVNLPATATDSYGGLLLISRLYLGLGDILGVQAPPTVIPPYKKLVAQLAPAGSVSWTDETGWHFKSVSPFPGSAALASAGGGSTLVVGEGALMASIMLPSLNRARETANRVKCASNERQIGQAILLYANENKGKYPPDLGTLVKTEDITAAVFVCPSGEQGVPSAMAADEAATWVNQNADYVYLGAGQKSDLPADRVVLYEKPGAHGGDGMNLLFGDGHVEFYRTAAAMQVISAQQAKDNPGGGGL